MCRVVATTASVHTCRFVTHPSPQDFWKSEWGGVGGGELERGGEVMTCAAIVFKRGRVAHGRQPHSLVPVHLDPVARRSRDGRTRAGMQWMAISVVSV